MRYSVPSKKNFARCDVGGRAWSCRSPRLCELAGCDLAHAASSMVAALLHLLVANMLADFLMLCICGAKLHQCTCNNAACQLTMALRPS